MSCDVGEVTEIWRNSRAQYSTFPSLQLRHNSFSNSSVALPMSQVIIQPFRRFTHVTAHSTALPLLHIRHRHFAYVTAHYPTFSPLYPRHTSFYSPSIASPKSKAVHLRHSSFSNPSVASPTPQLILQPFFRFSYVTSSKFTSPGELSMQFIA